MTRAQLVFLLLATACGRASVVPTHFTAEANAQHKKGLLVATPHAPTRAAPPARGRQQLEKLGLLYVPTAYDPSRPPGLLVVLHGSGGRAATMLGRFEKHADRLNLIMFAPHAGNWSWDLIAENAYGPDIAVIDGALELIFDRYAIDPERIGIAGHSDGASYSISLALGNGNIFKDALVFSGGFAYSTTVRGKPRVFIAHGRNDHILPIDKASHRMVPALERAGLTVRSVEYEGGHEMPPDIMVQGLDSLPPPTPRP